MAETKIIYHIDEEETPYLVKLPVPPEKVTLADFKNVLSNRPVHSYKFFFKSMDQDFGEYVEEWLWRHSFGISKRTSFSTGLLGAAVSCTEVYFLGTWCVEN
ncbi:hypothetical protein Q9233_015477 [Columba guinea]|nr:hypothetical protein Q9233_015477 [Columba guinea]